MALSTAENCKQSTTGHNTLQLSVCKLTLVTVLSQLQSNLTFRWQWHYWGLRFRHSTTFDTSRRNSIYKQCFLLRKNVDDRQRRGVLCSMKTTLILDWFWMYPDNYPHPPHIMITVSVAQLGWAVNRRIVTTPDQPVTLPLVSLTPLHWAEAGQTQHTNHFSSFCA